MYKRVCNVKENCTVSSMCHLPRKTAY